MDESLYQDIIDRLTKNGFDPEQIVKTVQIETRDMPPPETVDSVDLESYAGLWYQYARYDTIFDEDAEEVTAEYTLNDDGTVKVVNRGRAPGRQPYLYRRSCPGALIPKPTQSSASPSTGKTLPASNLITGSLNWMKTMNGRWLPMQHVLYSTS